MRTIFVLGGIFLLLIVAPFSNGYSSGISDVKTGCTCHGDGQISDTATVSVEGIPVNWSHGQSYNLFVNLSGPSSTGVNQGGFNLRVSAGTLTSLDDKTQILNDEATHTTKGNDERSWIVQWNAPDSGNIVAISVVGNAVNGNGVAGDGDHWDKKTVHISSSETTEDSIGLDGFSSEQLLTILMSIGFAVILIVTAEQIKYAVDDS